MRLCVKKGFITLHLLRTTTLVLAIAGILYGVLWALVATGLRDLSLTWINDQRGLGWAIAHDAPLIHGFPRWPKVAMTNVSVSAPETIGMWTWRIEALQLIPNNLNLTGLTINAPGRHTFHWLTSMGEIWTLQTLKTTLGIDLDIDGRWRNAMLTMENAELSDPLNRPLTGVARLDARLAVSKTDVPNGSFGEQAFVRFSGSADDFRVAITLGPFANLVRTARFDADLVGPIQAGRIPEALDAWRRGGGTVEVKRLFLDWPPLIVDADGTLALDNRLQPIGAFSTRITGLKEILATMHSRGIIDSVQASSAQIILGLMANTAQDGEPELSVPVSIQNQHLSIGPLDLIPVPELRWK